MTSRAERPNPAILARMADSLRHRGPDGSGVHLRDNVGMVHTRLAIIDLATGGHPLYEPGGAALVGNGEIYNYIELRKDLCFSQVAFATNSDFEPALHLYRKMGTAFTSLLRGMYAIAIHDPEEGRLILARDPFGIKPLYYVEGSDFFAFASEAQALTAGGLTEGTIEPDCCLELLRFHYTKGEHSAYPGVQRLLYVHHVRAPLQPVDRYVQAIGDLA